MSLSVGATEAIVPHVSSIPRSTHQEAGKLSQAAYERLLGVLAQLSGADWTQPTYCTEWTVRDMTAHLAGSVTGSTSLAEFHRQNVKNPYLKEFSDPVDGTNKIQLADRADKTPAELVAEFRRNGQVAVANRQKLPWLVRKVHLPMGSLGFASLEYLMDVIYPRDQWMHRYDICVAAGKNMVITPDHDGRIVALVLRDLARSLQKQIGSRTVDLYLVGVLEMAYRFGRGSSPTAVIQMDFFDFNLLASGRLKVADVRERTVVSGDKAAADWFLQHTSVVY